MIRWADDPLSDALFLLYLLLSTCQNPPILSIRPSPSFLPIFSMPAAVDCGIVLTGPEVSPALCAMCSLADFDPQ